MENSVAAAAAQDGTQQFAEQLVGFYNGGLLTLMIELGHRLGLFAAAASGPATCEELARRANLVERYVREWLGAMVTGRVFDYDARTKTYRLPPERGACLTGKGHGNLAYLATIVRFLAKNLPEVANAFREGGGVPYDRYFPAFSDFADTVSRGSYEGPLVDSWLPLQPELVSRLQRGARVADLGCGTGVSTNSLARAFPNSSFVGYDVTEDFVRRARLDAEKHEIVNVRFELLDVRALPVSPPLDVVFAFDAIHDMPDPRGVLVCVRDALVTDGIFVMVEPANSSRLEDNLDNPIAPLMYTASTLHCVPVSLACGGPGLGLVWGEQEARRLLEETGFTDITFHPAPGDPFNALYFSRPAAKTRGARG